MTGSLFFLQTWAPIYQNKKEDNKEVNHRFFLIMISRMIQRYFHVHLHNDLSMANKSKAKPFFVCFFFFFSTHLIPSPVWLHSTAAWWSHRLEAPTIVQLHPTKKKHEVNCHREEV